MPRAVLAVDFTGRWQLYRQPQWMAEVRRNPSAATWPKRYFDLEETAYRQAFDRWDEVVKDLATALELLGQLGASEVIRS